MQRASNGAVATAIKTPDQRLRVFISSTLGELAEERGAVRRAIERLRLAPVMFEEGARPHPPAELYRAYLEQSHLFIGVYWESYGWVAPGEEISGIEDEYLRSGSLPKLIYLKSPAPRRDERLADLVNRIGQRGISYKRFSDAEELERLVADDLALLLTESFEASTAQTVSKTDRASSNIPALVNAFVGREREVRELETMIVEGTARLITLSGPGGVGKSRLALELASRMKHRFDDGAFLVMLQSVAHPALVAASIGSTLGVDEAESSPLEAVLSHLRSKKLLLILDNFEQVVAASDVVVSILSGCRDVVIIVTSREVLNVRGEFEITLHPLKVPPQGEEDPERLSRFDAIRLFVERSIAANPRFELTEDNAAAVAELTRRLDGLPLAIELAAARSRIMNPKAMLSRLENRFRLLKGGWRELPERHHTLRSTIEWSFDLLPADEQKLFSKLSVFAGGGTLEAVEAVCGDEEIDVLDGLTSLVEKSLLRMTDDPREPRYTMLESIREYGLERLRESDDLASTCEKHASYFLGLAEAAGKGMRGPEQDVWLRRLDREIENIRAVLDHLFAGQRFSEAVNVGWCLWQFWWLRDHLDEGTRWMRRALGEDLAPLDRARARAVEGVMAFWQNDYGTCVPSIAEALVIFEDIGDEAGVALCELPLGFAETVIGDPDQALARFRRSCQIYDRLQDKWGMALSRIGLGWLWVGSMLEVPEDTFANAVTAAEAAGTRSEIGMAYGNLAAWQLRSGDISAARASIVRCVEPLFGSAIRVPSTYAIDVVAELAMQEGELDRAARFFGMSDGIRTAANAPLAPMHIELREKLLSEVRSSLGEDRFVVDYERGKSYRYPEAMHEVLEWARSGALARAG